MNEGKKTSPKTNDAKANKVSIITQMIVIDSPLLTVTQAALALELSEKHIRGLCSSKQITAYKKSKQWYILKEDLVKWVKN